jgi:hypothetical protein
VIRTLFKAGIQVKAQSFVFIQRITASDWLSQTAINNDAIWKGYCTIDVNATPVNNTSHA